MPKKISSKIAQISREDAESFTAGLGQITGGTYRLILLAHKQGVPQALGYNDTPAWVNDRLGGYVRHPIPERQKIGRELLAEGETQASIANALGVNNSTVSKDLSPKPSGKKFEIKDSAKGSKGKILEKQDSLPKDWDKSKPPDPDQLAEKGLELLVWEKVKDRFLPFWNELLESLEADEAAILSYVIWQHAPTEANV